ncbi:hypothetical protein LPW11_09830 [Geomonas sp. RF6]|uniref:hypothetical protein n=1 Tax=Geomonas sp. RF6 TaxID=2897342 RepID=UPI001E5968EE|nr:hypothetical protein [Geomonas sp. RF6]UFS72473.1 hypothetical protein LPW11_09830 [Geomonas sp. RF6]
MILQAKNFGGVCLKEFEEHAEEFPLLKEVVEGTNRYFDTLREIQKSSICAMEVPGYRRAARLHARRFSTEVSKGAEEHSIFAQIFKKVQLLYGQSWRSFLGGRLSDATNLQTISNSMELPRLEFFDPEGMMLRRLNASAQIAAISQGAADSEEEE